MYNINDRISEVLNNGENPNREFAEVYTALRIRLGYYPLIEGQEGFIDILTKFATFTIKSFAHGLFFVSERVFSSLIDTVTVSVSSYRSTLANWKNKVWKNALNIDGQKFDDYTIKMVPYNVLKNRINAVLAIHKALENVKAIMNSPVANNNYWLTNECQRAIDAMTKIGFNATNYNMLNDSVSSTYKNTAIKQPMFLHKYTLNNIMKLFNYVDKIADYADPKYIRDYQKEFEDCADKLDEQEGDIIIKEGEHLEDDNVEKKIAKDKYELSMRSARMWWIIHFIKASYMVTKDIFRDMETLAKVSEKCLA